MTGYLLDDKIPPGYLTRSMLKERAGLSDGDLKRLEMLGIVKPVRKAINGWLLYSETVLEKIHQRGVDKPHGNRRVAAVVYTSNEGANVFKLLKENMPLDEIVMKTNVHPLVVQQIRKDYVAIRNEIVISIEVLEKINKLPIDTELPIKDDEQLLKILEELSKEPQCTKCNSRPKGLCTGCAKQSIMNMIAKQATREAQKLQIQKLQNEKTTSETQLVVDEKEEKLVSNQ